jgi:hypothetical protein
MMMEKMINMSSDINELAQNTLFYSPVELMTKHTSQSVKDSQESSSSKREKEKEKEKEDEESSGSSSSTSTSSGNKRSSDSKKHTSFKYSVFDLDLTTLLFKFYYLNVLTDLISLQTDKDILQLPMRELEEASPMDEDDLISKSLEQDILLGNQTELSEKIANIIVTFTNLVCKDKTVIDYNYKGLMDLILRSKEKEKDDITDYLKNMADEERAVENLFKNHKLGRWSKGEQKGLHTYDTKTYDQEREEMEAMALREVQLNKRNVVTDMNRDIFMLDKINDEANDADIDKEDTIITYMGEDAEPEDYDMDGDENF